MVAAQPLGLPGPQARACLGAEASWGSPSERNSDEALDRVEDPAAVGGVLLRDAHRRKRPPTSVCEVRETGGPPLVPPPTAARAPPFGDVAKRA